MSTFSGRLHESPNISIDRFDGDNLHSTVFFLSHCHYDHMIGLASDNCCDYLQRNDFKLYCHSTTKILLMSIPRYRRLEHFVSAVDYGVKFEVFIKSKTDDVVDCSDACLPSTSSSASESVQVTFIDALHCPGSAMILFEFKTGKTVLYTGDYRFSNDDWLSCEPLKNPSTPTGFKQIDSFYFDSTFCRKGTEKFPSRKHSTMTLVRMVREWLAANPDNKVLLWNGRFGHELFLRAIWDKLRLQCHVSVEKFRIYSQLPDIGECVTSIARSCRVHACAMEPTDGEECFEEIRQNVVPNIRGTSFRRRQQISPCGFCLPDGNNVLVIKPSTIWFARRKEKNVLAYSHGHFRRLLYSAHSSLSEVVDAFRLLRPLRAYPNVLERKGSDRHQQSIAFLLKEFVSDASVEEIPNGCPEVSPKKRLHVEEAVEEGDGEMQKRRRSLSADLFDTLEDTQPLVDNAPAASDPPHFKSSDSDDSVEVLVILPAAVPVARLKDSFG